MSKICPQCSTENLDEATFCFNCGAKLDDVSIHKESTSEESIYSEPEKDYSSIGGWLILLGIGIFFGPLILMGQVTQMYSDIADAITAISDATSNAYNPSLAFFIKIEKFINWSLVLLSFYLWFLFFGKKRDFRIWFIAINLFSIIFIVADAIIISNLVPGISGFDADVIKQLFRSILYSIIWIPYLLISQRAKKTFVN